MITHLEPDILEHEVKWALGSITTNKASDGEGIPVELFQILKWCCESAAFNMPANLENSAVATTGKGQFSLQSQRKAIPKNTQTTAQFHSSHTLVMLKILQARLQQYEKHELSDIQAGFRKGRGVRDQIANIRQIIKKAGEFQKNIYFCFIDYAKAFDCVDHSKLWIILQEM